MERITFEPSPEQVEVLHRLKKETGNTAHHLISQALDRFIAAEFANNSVRSFDELAEKVGLTGWTEETLMAEIQKGIDSGDPTPLDMEDIKKEARQRWEKQKRN